MQVSAQYSNRAVTHCVHDGVGLWHFQQPAARVTYGNNGFQWTRNEMVSALRGGANAHDNFLNNPQKQDILTMSGPNQDLTQTPNLATCQLVEYRNVFTNMETLPNIAEI